MRKYLLHSFQMISPALAEWHLFTFMSLFDAYIQENITEVPDYINFQKGLSREF